ncbi:MAG: hypothetical protein NTY48_02675 [Candidatus Diapherotrites archaeon]|nr:hypothetical protein [Candidatus Diapherotrites archaeon]
MVNFFGDWSGDFSVILLLFAALIIAYLFLMKDNKSRNSAGLFVCVAIFLISGFAVLGVVFNNSFYGPSEGFWIIAAAMVASLVGTLIELSRVLAEK